MAQEQQRLRAIENRVRGSLDGWYNMLETITAGLKSMAEGRETLQKSTAAAWVAQIQRATTEMRQADSDLTVIAQDLAAAKTDAEYREVLVRAWPTNHVLDRMTYLGAAVLGAGGAAYVLVGREVSILFWLIGGAIMVWGLVGLARWERKKWDFYADQFSVDPKYRPAIRLLRRRP